MDADCLNLAAESCLERKHARPFPGYYRPTKEQFVQMWQECIFPLSRKRLFVAGNSPHVPVAPRFIVGYSLLMCPQYIGRKRFAYSTFFNDH